MVSRALVQARERAREELMPKAHTYTRLTHPMVREAGELREATWAEALDRAGARTCRRYR